MNFRRTLALASIGSIAYLAQADAAQPALADSNGLTRQQNDARMTQCSREAGAYARIAKSHDELQNVQKAFASEDPLNEKLGTVLNQLNDAMQTIQKRNKDRCPGQSLSAR